MSIKVDMRKAYDIVEWDFLDRILEIMGFDSKLTRLIMNYVKSVSFSIFINGVPKGYIMPSRGLR